MSNSVTKRYEALVAAGEVQHDPAQLAVAAALDDVASDLTAQVAADERGVGGFFRRRLGRTPRAVKGLYVWGEVGRGKTMLMDLFYETIDVERKRRLHFNDFMADAHARIAALRKSKVDDAVVQAADDLAEEARVLCFDEFAVTDIADAMILARLFRQLFARGVTLVATSNVAPNDLYKEGLNRQLFVPFIHALREYVDVVRLDADVDYRLDRLKDFRVWFAPGDEGFERLWATLLGERAAAPTTVKVASRSLDVPRAAGGLARFGFSELVEQPRSANDFIALAKRFHTIFLEDIPVLTPDRRETTRRFINLVDVLYDQKVRLVATAAAEPDALFDPGENGGRYEGFAFARTASRLHEMRSASYLSDLESTPMT
ncbi:cell division protein ZapE [Acuticoccus sp. I52.16.1]|uniref:cell division protein ZapE n=1 Tax=Acuticoccus sp. I52.16.1 TaxID=2928472 RepID=UPI001FD11542|nr:cell division protein ZapE [Acuticoccus sp. I52.16.1]UOM33436.1 cell division protein ZapE [Acuticoccus sp. I52.16.1]